MHRLLGDHGGVAVVRARLNAGDDRANEDVIAQLDLVTVLAVRHGATVGDAGDGPNDNEMPPRTITINEPFAGPGVTCKSEPITHTFDEAALGEGPARAIARVITEQLRGLAQLAKRQTIERRARAKAAIGKAVRTTVERYGDMAPTGSQRLFNDSGRLAELLVKLAGDAWQVVTSSSRLEASTFGAAELEAMMVRLRQMIPALRAPLEQREVRDAIEKTPAMIIRVGRAR